MRRVPRGEPEAKGGRPPSQAASQSRIQDQRRPPADGAKIDIAYNGAIKAWHGTLTIDGKVFEGSASGVFKLLCALDRDFRASLAPAPAKEEIAND